MPRRGDRTKKAAEAKQRRKRNAPSDPGVDMDESLRNMPVMRLKALEVLAGGGRIVDAASKAGVSERAVRYWMETAEFRSHLDAVRAAYLTRARLKSAALVDRALDAVSEALHPELTKLQKGAKRNPMTTRLRAASLVFDAVGLLKAGNEPPVFDEQELEDVLKRNGWVKQSEAG